jgi:hypothetical protein
MRTIRNASTTLDMPCSLISLIALSSPSLYRATLDVLVLLRIELFARGSSLELFLLFLKERIPNVLIQMLNNNGKTRYKR